jgi:plastocyanin
MTDEHHAPRPRQSLLLPVVIPLGILAVIAVVLWSFSRVLLRVRPHVATATALVVAAAIVAIVSVAASRKRVGNGSLLTVAVGVCGVGMLASGAALLVGEVAGEGEQVTVAITAPSGAAASGYAETSLSAPADEAFTIGFDNQDVGVQHDVVLASANPAKDPSATLFVDGAVITGPAQASYPVQALPQGDYFFFCKIHPTVMQGSLTVVPGVEPGGGGGPSISASGLAFDTDTLTFQSDAETALAFQNNDAGVQHNLAIYTDDSATETLFKGDPVTGVGSATYTIPALKAGTYFFRCDFHPEMNGTVHVEAGGKPPPGGGSPPPSGSATPSASPTSTP